MADPRVSPGERAYLLDVQRQPTYQDGKPRKTWAQLDDIMRASWERNPTTRPYPPWTRYDSSGHPSK